MKAPLQAELLVQYVTDVTACKRLKSAPEVEKCKKSVKSVKSEKKGPNPKMLLCPFLKQSVLTKLPSLQPFLS